MDKIIFTKIKSWQLKSLQKCLIVMPHYMNDIAYIFTGAEEIKISQQTQRWWTAFASIG